MLKTLSLLLFFNLLLTNCAKTLEALDVLSSSKNFSSQVLESDETSEDFDLDEELDTEDSDHISYFINQFLNQTHNSNSYLANFTFKASPLSIEDFITDIDFPPEF